MFRVAIITTLMISSFHIRVDSLFSFINNVKRPLSSFNSIESTALDSSFGMDRVGMDRDRYLFGKAEDFQKLGVTMDLHKALEAIGKGKATSIQASSFPSIISGKDTVIAAETGSGKTLAYLVPLFHKILEGTTISSVYYPSVIVLTPNKELCAQVDRMAKEIVSSLAKYDRVVTTEVASSFIGRWPYHDKKMAPSILICTPSYIAKYVKGPIIIDEDLFRNVRHIVLDEADMLFDGSYIRDVENVLGKH